MLVSSKGTKISGSEQRAVRGFHAKSGKWRVVAGHDDPGADGVPLFRGSAWAQMPLL